jgi:hypothetical protein
VFDKYHTNILFGYFNAKVGREDMFKPTENERIHKISNDNRVRLVNLSHLKTSRSKVRCSHIAPSINILGFLQMGKSSQIEHILIGKGIRLYLVA